MCDAVTPPRIPRKEKNVLTKQQAHTLLEGVKAQRLEALLTLAITTGMRDGELLALHWQDVNFEDCSLQVKRGELLERVWLRRVRTKDSEKPQND